MNTTLLVIAVVLLIIFLYILEEHLKRVGRVGGRLAEEIKERLLLRFIAVIITIGIILLFSEYTGINMATELFATIAGAVGIAVATVLQDELEMRGLV